jgi:hypothetical protein
MYFRPVKIMGKIGGRMSWLVIVSVAVVMTLAVVPALAGSAAANPAPLSAAAASSDQWAYGGMGWSNSTLASANEQLSWNASFGWTVIFTSTNTSSTTVQIEEQRTVGINLTATYSGPDAQARYGYAGHESDVAFANLTNNSTVYENGVPVAALGLENDTTRISGSIAESISVTTAGVTKSASLDVTGSAHTSAQFTPSLGLVPLNLSGPTTWNSSSVLSPSGSWNISYAWANTGFGGRMGSGALSSNGTVSTPGAVDLTGYDVSKTSPVPIFPDHVPRQAVVLVVQGPLGNYDAFVLVPRSFDLFGGGLHAYDPESLGSATISAETLYVSGGARGPEVTAASSTFGANTPAVGTLGAPTTGVSPAASGSPGTTVTGSPMSVSQAQAESNCLTGACSAASAAAVGAGALVIVATLAVVAVVGTVIVIEWRSYGRRKSRTGIVGGYGEGQNRAGIPPGVAGPTPQQAPNDPASSSPTASEDSTRLL